MNLQHEFLVILDETACQNTPNTSRVLYESGTKNTIAKIPNRIKINMIRYQSINCQSYVEVTKKIKCIYLFNITMQISHFKFRE